MVLSVTPLSVLPGIYIKERILERLLCTIGEIHQPNLALLQVDLVSTKLYIFA